MEAASGRSRVRLLVVDFLATLFTTFCIGVAAALALGTCVVLMSGEARGAAPAKAPEAAASEPSRLAAAELMLAHYFAAKYTGLVPIDRIHAATAPASEPASCSRGVKAKAGERCSQR
jgi:hypothetical protein